MDLPSELLSHVLRYCDAATLIRSTMACRGFQLAALEQARLRITPIAAREDDEPWELMAKRPLATLFQWELDRMLAEVDDWEGARFLYFRLQENDVDWAVGNGEPLLLCDGRTVEWLHDEHDYQHYHGCACEWLGESTHDTWWQSTACDHIVYTEHLALHPTLGRYTASIGDLLTHPSSDGTLTDKVRAWCQDSVPDTDAAAFLSHFGWDLVML